MSEEEIPDLRDAIQRVGEFVTAWSQVADGRDLIAEEVYDDGRGGWSGELYVSDLRALLDAAAPDEWDVAERLEAASAAMDAHRRGLGAVLRLAASDLRRMTPEVRAAVAAAFAGRAS